MGIYKIAKQLKSRYINLCMFDNNKKKSIGFTLELFFVKSNLMKRKRVHLHENQI